MSPEKVDAVSRMSHWYAGLSWPEPTARRYTFLCALPVDLSFDGGGTVDTDPLDRDDQGASVRDFLTCRRGAQRHAYSLRTIHMGDPCIVHSSARCISLSGKQRALL